MKDLKLVSLLLIVLAQGLLLYQTHQRHKWMKQTSDNLDRLEREVGEYQKLQRDAYEHTALQGGFVCIAYPAGNLVLHFCQIPNPGGGGK